MNFRYVIHRGRKLFPQKIQGPTSKNDIAIENKTVFTMFTFI